MFIKYSHAVNLTDGCQSFEDFATANDAAQAIANFSDADIIADMHPPSNELSDDDDGDTVFSSTYILTTVEALKYTASLCNFECAKALSASHLDHLDDLENAMGFATVCKQATLTMYFQ